MKRLLFGTVLFFITIQVCAQYDFNARCREAYNAVSNLELEKGQELLDIELLEHPDNLIPVYIENYIDFLRMAIGEKEEDYKSLRSNKGDRIRKLEQGSDTSPYYLYCLAGINLQWAMARAKFNDYTRAVFEARKAYFMLQKNHEQFPDFTPNLVGLGLLHTLVGTIPDEYQWVAGIFGMQGSVNEGLEELHLAASRLQEGDLAFLYPECLFFITFLSMNFQADPGLENGYLEMLDHHAKESILIRYAYGRYLMKSGQNDRAIQVLSDRERDNSHYPFHYLDYLLGKAKLNRLDTDADKFFYLYVSNHKGENYIKAGYQKLAWFNLVNGNEKGYYENMNRVLQYGHASVDADKQAMMEAESGSVPNVNLLKGRLLFDGGYYPRAERTLLGTGIILGSKKDSVEFNYRLGRIYHSMGSHDKAMLNYKKCIEGGRDLPYYYSANAALHVGMIYEERGNYKDASKYYEKCTDMDFTEYRASILQKAKAGLDRVKQR
jgi:tetratricopeptide (TPR) repeat protein